MTASASRQRKLFLYAALLIAFSAFTADIIDLREELRFISCTNSCFDNNITTGLASHSAIEAEPILIACSTHQKSSIKTSFLHLLPYGVRAPPSRS